VKYYLIQRQAAGCDYTIGCGIRITQLNATSMPKAKEKAAEEIGGAWRTGTYEIAILSADLLEVSKAINLEDFLNQKKLERDAQAQVAAEAEKWKKGRKRVRTSQGEAMPMKFYKIFDTSTGLYSSGGTKPCWNKVGKTWMTLAQVVKSLKVYCNGTYRTGRRVPPESWVVQEFEAPSPVSTSARAIVKP